jgi:hypothetical protein
MTDCTQAQLEFQGLDCRRVEADFDAGHVTSDGGALLLRQLEARLPILSRVGACFKDRRDPDRICHTLEQMIIQRIMGLCLGWEDLLDHDQLRHDPMMAVLVGKADPQNEPVAGKSTLNRLELSPDLPVSQATRYHKITADFAALDRLLVDLFVEAHDTPPSQIILDLDATDDPVHGQQEGRFFHGYYGHYCYFRCTSFAAIIFCARGFARRISTPRRAGRTSCRALSPRSAGTGQTRASSCGQTRAFAASH